MQPPPPPLLTTLQWVRLRRTSRAVMLDLKNTFDTVDLEILTKKLQWFGIKDMPLPWFENYFTDRKQTVQFKTEQSAERPVNCGVPQGSILGPLLLC